MLKRTVPGLECEAIGHDGRGLVGRDGNAGQNDGSGSSFAGCATDASLTLRGESGPGQAITGAR
jgi:hypothetical protein